MRVIELLTHISMASYLWDIGKQHSPRCDVAGYGGSILFAKIFIIKYSMNIKSHLMPPSKNGSVCLDELHRKNEMKIQFHH